MNDAPYWSGSSSRHYLRFLSNIFKKQSRNLCFTPLLFCKYHNDLPTKWNFIKDSHAHRGSIITMLRFLTENGRNRSNYRQLSEICDNIGSMYKLAVKVIDDVNSACAGGHLHSHGIYFYSANVSILDCRDE